VKVKRSFAIGASTVTSFGYRKDMDGKWLKKDMQPPQDECTRSPPPQRDDSSTLMHEVLSVLRGLHTYVGEHFDSLDGRINAIDARFVGMDTRIPQLEEDISYVHQCFDLPPPSS